MGINASRKLRIYLADLAYFNKNTEAANTIPLNIGYIASYALKLFGNECEITLFKNPDRLIEQSKIYPPDILGLSCYFWNYNLGILASKHIKKINPDCVILVGGPSVDTDVNEQFKLFQSFGGSCNALVLNEGELGFSNFINVILSSGVNSALSNPPDGCIFFKDNTPFAGKDVGLSLDLATLPSPIISGLLDEFLTVDYLPLIQTSRMCPYTCAFCVSGKLNGKIRIFSEAIVEEEIKVLAEKYRKYPHKKLFFSDQNFGILRRDVAIAKNLVKVSRSMGWPKGVFTYLDKKFTATLREIILELGDMSSAGLPFPLQTLNEESLKAMKRKNITAREIDEIVEWAKKNKIRTSSEFIFGLPFESKKSFHMLIEVVLQKKIDMINIYNLFLLQGIELNRAEERERFGIKTKFRPATGSAYGVYKGEFVCEVEEVVVETPHFSFDDFHDIRKIALLLFATTYCGYFKRVIDYYVDKKIPIVPIYDRLMNPPETALKEHADFVDSFANDAKQELFDSYEAAKEFLRQTFIQNGNDVGNPTRLNVLYSSRLIYMEKWFQEVINSELEGNDPVLSELIQFSVCEWVDLLHPRKISEIVVSGACLSYLGIHDCAPDGKKYRLIMSSSEEQISKIESYNAHVSSLGEPLYYYDALSSIEPKKSLRYERYKVEPL